MTIALFIPCFVKLMFSQAGVSIVRISEKLLARHEQMVTDPSAAFELLSRKYPVNYPRMILFITGPSRTGDSDGILVQGAHGPKRLAVFMV
jgi:L-lactate dehydrogenase complex protein LldG